MSRFVHVSIAFPEGLQLARLFNAVDKEQVWENSPIFIVVTCVSEKTVTKRRRDNAGAFEHCTSF